MKNPRRIKRIIKLINKIWNKNPNLRLCQLIGNCFLGNSIYYIEDDILEEQLKKIYKESL